ncbi:MAG: HEAT repeat domain-containing protein, partial [Phycisphaeraceae bacterium]
MSKLRSPRLSLVIFSLLLTAVIALGAAFLLRNNLQRRQALHKLRGTDAAQRLEGMIYVCRFAPSDPVLRDTLQRWLLDPANDDKLKSDIIRSLRCADIWGPSFGKAWLQWLDHIAQAELPGQRVGVCFEIARAAFAHQPVIADPDTAALLQKLARDPSPDVRYWAVRAAATLPEKSLASVLDIALRDGESVVVRHAKIIDALMRGQQPTPPPKPGQSESFPGASAAPGSADPPALAEIYRNASTSGDPASDAKAAFAASRLAPRFDSDSVPGVADVLKPIIWTGREGYQLRELAVIENLPPQSIDLDIDSDWPPLVRVAAARAS